MREGTAWNCLPSNSREKYGRLISEWKSGRPRQKQSSMLNKQVKGYNSAVLCPYAILTAILPPNGIRLRKNHNAALAARSWNFNEQTGFILEIVSQAQQWPQVTVSPVEVYAFVFSMVSSKFWDSACLAELSDVIWRCLLKLVTLFHLWRLWVFRSRVLQLWRVWLVSMHGTKQTRFAYFIWSHPYALHCWFQGCIAIRFTGGYCSPIKSVAST